MDYYAHPHKNPHFDGWYLLGLIFLVWYLITGPLFVSTAKAQSWTHERNMDRLQQHQDQFLLQQALQNQGYQQQQQQQRLLEQQDRQFQQQQSDNFMQQEMQRAEREADRRAMQHRQLEMDQQRSYQARENTMSLFDLFRQAFPKEREPTWPERCQGYADMRDCPYYMK